MFQFTNLSVHKYGQLEKNRGKSEEYFWDSQGSMVWLVSEALKSVVLRHVMISKSLSDDAITVVSLMAPEGPKKPVRDRVGLRQVPAGPENLDRKRKRQCPACLELPVLMVSPSCFLQR